MKSSPVPSHFSALARRLEEPPISWLMKWQLDRPELISLAAGFTDNESLPVEEMRCLTREILRSPRQARRALQYGTTNGDPELRQRLYRRWLRQDRLKSGDSPLRSERILVTNGSQQLLYLVSEVLGDPGDIVLVEDPTYFVYLGIIEALGLRAFGFADLAGLEARLAWLESRGWLPRLKFLYLVTYFRNPTGTSWSADMKQEALRLLRRYERRAGHPLYIVEDAAYRDLRFEGRDTPSFLAFDRRGERVVYANTLTKPFATGLKLGYGILPEPLLRSVRRSKGNHDFGSANFLQALLARALASGLYDAHLGVIHATYRRKRDAMVAALRSIHDARFVVPRGGLYVWLELAEGIDTGTTSRLFRAALKRNLLYVPGAMCYCRDTTRPVPPNRIRLSFGAAGVGAIRRGVRLLGAALEATAPRPSPRRRRDRC